jgi:hypothetical protein
MLSFLHHPLTDDEQQDARTLLSLNSWCWPLESDTVGYQKALSIHPEGPPQQVVGQIPLLTVDPSARTGSIHALVWSDSQVHASRTRDFGSAGMIAYDTAIAALNRSIPLLYEPLRGLEQHRPHSIYIDSFAPRGTVPRLVRSFSVLDGKSFGLAFAMSQASKLFNQVLPSNIATTAQVDEHGRIHPVDGITAKITVVANRCPRITRLLVAEHNREEAELAAHGSALQIVTVSTVADALDCVFPDNWLETLLLERSQSPSDRETLCCWFFQVAIGGRDAAPHWNPLGRAAELLLREWSKDLNEAERNSLTFARSVAARHQGEVLDDPWIPSDDWMNSQPKSVRKEVAAHIVQQSADMSKPEPETTRTFANRFLESSPLERGAADLKLMGALARLDAVTGRPRLGLDWARQAAQGWKQLCRPEDSTHALCMWYNLARGLEDEAAIRAADSLHEAVVKGGKLSRESGFYLTLFSAAARLVVDLDVPASKCALGRLANGLDGLGHPAPNLPGHVRWSALRRFREHFPGEETPAILEELESLHSKAENDAGARRFSLLIKLDEALVADHQDDAETFLADLAVMDGARTYMLIEAAGLSREDPAAYVSRFYPY